MDLGPLIVIIVRLLVPFSIFRWPFWGTIASGFFDLIDVVLISIIGAGDFSNYSAIDKGLDTYYLLFCLIVSLKWKDALAKWTSAGLFAYRVIGVLIFEFFLPARILFFIFPNLFEHWFLFWTARNKWFPKFQLTVKRLIVILVILLIPKMFQEWLLHWKQAQPWEWIKDTTGLFR